MQTDIYFTDSTDINDIYLKLASLSEWVMRNAFLNEKSNLKEIRMIVHWPFTNLQGGSDHKLKIIISNMMDKYRQALDKSLGSFSLVVKVDHRKNIVTFVWRKTSWVL